MRHRGGRCRAAELHRALRELPARRAAAAERLESCREAKTRAREAAKEASKKLAASLRRWKKAEQENDLGSKLDETKMVKQLEILAQNAKDGLFSWPFSWVFHASFIIFPSCQARYDSRRRRRGVPKPCKKLKRPGFRAHTRIRIGGGA